MQNNQENIDKLVAKFAAEAPPEHREAVASAVEEATAFYFLVLAKLREKLSGRNTIEVKMAADHLTGAAQHLAYSKADAYETAVADLDRVLADLLLKALT